MTLQRPINVQKVVWLLFGEAERKGMEAWGGGLETSLLLLLPVSLYENYDMIIIRERSWLWLVKMLNINSSSLMGYKLDSPA